MNKVLHATRRATRREGVAPPWLATGLLALAVPFHAAAGRLDLGAAAAEGGPTVVEQGRLEVLGKLAGPVRVNPQGELGGTGLIGGEVSNAGVVAPGTVDAMGELHLAGGYTGQGGTLRLRTTIASDASASDSLVLQGAHAGGTSLVQIVNQGGPGVLTRGNGIPVIRATQGATTEDGAFRLLRPLVQGPYQYELYRGALDGSDAQGWYLRSRNNEADPAGGQLAIGALRPEVSLYAAMPSLLQIAGQESLADWHTRQGNSDQARARGGSHYWVRSYGGNGEVDGKGFAQEGPKFDHSVWAMQAGADLVARRTREQEDRLGGYVGYGSATAHVDHEGGAAGSIDADSFQLGGYWTHRRAGGIYIDTVLQAAVLPKIASRSQQGIDAQTDGWSLAGSIEAGREFPISQDARLRLEPQAQLSLQRLRLKDFADAGGTVSMGDYDSVSARVGARLVNHWGGDPAAAGASGPESGSAWVRMSLQHEFSGDATVGFATADGPLQARSNLGGTVLDTEVGVSTRLESSASGQVSVGFQKSVAGVTRSAMTGTGTVNAGGTMGAAVGLRKALSKSASVDAQLSYGRGGDDRVTAQIGLNSTW